MNYCTPEQIGTRTVSVDSCACGRSLYLDCADVGNGLILSPGYNLGFCAGDITPTLPATFTIRTLRPLFHVFPFCERLFRLLRSLGSHLVATRTAKRFAG